MSAAASKEKGDQFEKRVQRLLQRAGKWRVRRDVVLRDKFGNISQIDLTYGLLRTTYVECKNYSGPVPLEMVAKFKEVLALNNVPLSRGLFVTSSNYVPRATTIGVRTIDGNELNQWEKSVRGRWLVRRSFQATLLFTAVPLVGYALWNNKNEFSRFNYQQLLDPKWWQSNVTRQYEDAKKEAQKITKRIFQK
jgi:hypothetical protein